MDKINFIKNLISGTLLSILVFFSVSFISFLTQINPLHYYKEDEMYQLKIGFPFQYYQQFWVSGNTIPNSNWTIQNLILDCFITWIFVLGFIFLKRKLQHK